MTMRWRKFAIASILAAAVIVAVAAITLKRIDAGMKASVEHKSAKHATATVTNVVEMESSASRLGNKPFLYKVCFTIDDFDEVENESRQGYRSAEARRLSDSGPRCNVTSNIGIARTLTRGSKLSLVYLLENDYQIDIVSVTASGEDL